MPPNEIVFKGVADFLKDKDLADIDALALEVFKEAGYDLTEAASKLKESVGYYSALLEKRDYPHCKLLFYEIWIIFRYILHESCYCTGNFDKKTPQHCTTSPCSFE